MSHVPLSPLRPLHAAVLAAVASAGASCASFRAVPVRDLRPDETAGLEVALDANARTVNPGRRVKFWVEVTNRTGSPVDFTETRVELLVSPVDDPDTVRLRKTWSWRWEQPILLAPDKRLTLPIVPERKRHRIPPALAAGTDQPVVQVSEFPLAELSPGAYHVRARVDGNFTSPPYSLRVDRPDLPSLPPAREGEPPAGR